MACWSQADQTPTDFKSWNEMQRPSSGYHATYYRLSIYRGTIKHVIAQSTPTSKVKFWSHFELTQDTHTSPSRVSNGCLSWLIRRKVTLRYWEHTVPDIMFLSSLPQKTLAHHHSQIMIGHWSLIFYKCINLDTICHLTWFSKNLISQIEYALNCITKIFSIFCLTDFNFQGRTLKFNAVSSVRMLFHSCSVFDKIFQYGKWYLAEYLSTSNVDGIYCHTSNIRCTLVGNKTVDHSDVVGTSPVGTASTTSSFLTQRLASMDCAKTTARQDGKHLRFGIWCALYQRFNDIHFVSNN